MNTANAFALLLAALGLLCIALPPAIAAPAKPAEPVRFYVAPDGKDANPGTKAKPFATLARARDAAGGVSGPTTVIVRGGFYALAEPLTFTPKDSRPADAPLTFAAAPGERPVVSGGTRLTGWRRAGGNRYTVTLPDVAAGKWYFSQLYVNGERRYRPRLPKAGYYFVAGALEPSPRAQGKGFDRFRYSPGDIDPNWKNRDDIEVLPFHIWTMSRFKIAEIDAAQRIVAFTGQTRGTSSWSSLPRGNRYLVDNVAEALSEPGEWYLDRRTGVLTYLAKPGEDPERAEIVAPRLDTLVQIGGDPEKREFVSHITFQGIAFAHAGWNIGPEGNSYPQAEVALPAAVRVLGGRGITFVNCAVRHIGTYAVGFEKGSKQCVLQNCELTDLGAGGVKIGETQNYADAELLASDNAVRDCLIAEGGRIHPAAVGVWIGHSPNNVVEHNEIVDLYYSGISVGWSWGYNPSGAYRNTFADNHVHRIGQGVLSDMGGLYSLGLSSGTLISHNLFHDIVSYDYGGWGIYFDEGSTGIRAVNNIAYDCKSAPFHQHYGTNNVVENNILAYGREAQLMRTRADNGDPSRWHEQDKLSFTLERNIVLWKEGPLLGSNWSGVNFTLNRNLYWNAAPGHAVSFAGGTLEAWQAKGHDRDSLIADPLFVAPEAGDFRLRPGSPAEKIGFRPVPLTGFGRRTAKPYAGNAPRAFPPPPPPTPIADGFESYGVGDRPDGPQVSVNVEPNTGGTILVTDETAASGKQSLKFTDAAGQKFPYNPHLYYKPKFTDGTITGRFALRLEAGGAVFSHEWRDSASPYRVGPSLHIDADGTLKANGRELTRLPLGVWVQFETVCRIGDDAPGTYSLTVRLPGRTPPMKFADLPCGSGKEFRTLRWWGFVAEANAAGVFYLDDVALLKDGAP